MIFQRRSMLVGSSLKFVIALALAQAGAVAFPADPRLDPVRAPAGGAGRPKSAEAGLPAELLVSKVREGLAKGVPADRIEAAAGRLAEGLAAARGFVRERHPGARRRPSWCARWPRRGWRASSWPTLDPVVRGARPGPETARAVEVLTDLSLRGYPASRALVAGERAARARAGGGRPPAGHAGRPPSRAGAQPRRGGGRAGAGPARGRFARDGVRRAADARRGAGQGKSKQGGEGEGGNKEGFVPPGQLKKQSGTKGRPAENPGRGMGPKPK